MKNLYLSKEFAPGIAAALQELVGARITEVLPNLQNIFVEALEPSGPFQENIGQFVAARELSSHPVAISDWDRFGWNEKEEEEESALLCMHSTLPSIGREADIATQEENYGRNWRRFFWVHTSLALLPSSVFPLFRSPSGNEERQGHKRSVDLNQRVCLSD